MNMQTSVITCFKKFLTIEGRASRSEYWWFGLFIIVISLLLVGLVDWPLFGNIEMSPSSNLWSIITLLPSICVSVRRLHDIDKSGWWLLLMFLPVIGWIVLIVFACIKGTDGDNRFGKDPFMSF